MGKRTNRQQPPPNELVSHYREIGIPAVAAAARYQARDRAGTRLRRQGSLRENPQDNSLSRENANENVEALVLVDSAQE